MICAWACTAVAGAIALWLLYGRIGQRESVVRAAHELRGSLQTIELGLVMSAGERDRAMRLELDRARLALQDLETGRRRARVDDPVPIDASSLLDDAVRAAGPRAAAAGKRVSWQWEGPGAAVHGSRVRMIQALGNLTINAIEHGDGPVILRGRRAGPVVRLEVCDGGPGLSAPVSELTRRARCGIGRRGRGLAIAQDIATLHGGRLAAAPTQRDARLVFELPACVCGSDSVLTRP